MICSAWVRFNHHAKNNVPRMRPSGETSPDEIHIRYTDTKCERSEERWGSGGLRPHPSDRSKVPIFVKKSPLKEAVELD